MIEKVVDLGAVVAVMVLYSMIGTEEGDYVQD